MVNSTILNGSVITQNMHQQCILGTQDQIQIVLYALVIIIGVIGNAGICYCFGLFHKSSRKSVSEVLILYLAVVDFFASIFNPFIFIYWIATCNVEWHFGTVGCKILPFLGRFFINISVGIICILAFDRYRAICSPFQGQFRKLYVHIAVLIATCLSILCEVYYLDALTHHKKPLPLGSKGCLVTPDNNLRYIKVTSSLLLVRDIFFVLMFTFTSIRIIISLKRRNSYPMSPTCGNTLARNNRHEMERVIRVIIVMQIVFITLVLPRDLLHIIFSLSWIDNDGIPYSKDILRMNDALKVIQTANSCVNVFIYAKMHDRFRKRALEMIQTSFACGKLSWATSLFGEQKKKLSVTQSMNNNLTPSYSRNLLKTNNPSSPGFANGETAVYEIDPSPAINYHRKQFLTVPLNGSMSSINNPC